MKRNVMSWSEFKKYQEELPIEKGKSKDPEYSKRKAGKSSGHETLDKSKKHVIPENKKGKKGKIDVMDEAGKKTNIKDESQLKKAKKEVKDIMQTSNKGVSKKGDLPKVKTGKQENLKYAKKKLKANGK